jgi:2-polyprenyl-3-methyl-5-hydroxy-6-metoxy-1,4-benzoquinol methylase
MLLPRFPADPFPSRTAHVVWDETACPLCGSEDATTLLESPDVSVPDGLMFAVVQCRHCAMRYTNPRPDAESIASFYPSEYKPHRRPNKQRATHRLSWWDRLLRRSCPERRGELPWPTPGRLLDFGCGNGSFLQRMANQGWHVVGLDTSPQAVQTVHDTLGLTAHVGSLPHPDLRPGTFDVVTMWHSLEHVHEPLATLGEIYHLLVPGGKLIVACPNIDSAAYEWFRSSWFALDLPRHLLHFTPKTLQCMLQTAGFQVESCRTIRHSDWLRSSAKLATRAIDSPIWIKPLTWKPIAKTFAWVIDCLGRSDCMIAIAERPKLSPHRSPTAGSQS